MGVNLKRPILVGGVGLSFALYLLQGWHNSVAALGEYSVVGAIALLSGLWLFKQYRFKGAVQLDHAPTDRATVEKAIAQAESVVSHLETEAQNHQVNSDLRQRIAQLHTQTLCWSETPALFTDTDNLSLKAAIASDLVLFVTNGDLTDSEYQVLQQLATNQRLVLVFNKQDQYLPDERAAVLHSIQQRMQPLLKAEDVVAIAASPSPILVRQYQTDDTAQEWIEERSPQITQLTTQLSQILVQSGQQLVWATTKRAADNLKAEAKTVLNQVRRDRALPIVEQYQWIAAAAAFANPVPALDLLATAAINAQLVIELGAIYQQKFSLQQAQEVAGTMGSLMLKLGLVELSTKAVSTVLKSNAVTFVAGGVVQGVSAAYLTRLAGYSLIEYFQQQEVEASTTGLNLDKLGQTLQNVFVQNQQMAFLQGFVKQSVGRLSPQSPQPQSVTFALIALICPRLLLLSSRLV